MECKNCSAPIPETARFCPNCGASVEGIPVPANRPSVDGFSLIRNYIPKELAERILAAGKQIESERRLVTVLFADVTGFTALSEKLDLEDVSAVLNDCFSGLVASILKYEGTIDKFIGDGIMAIFGAPLAHENDPERAVRCALEMMESIERFNRQTAINLPTPLGLHVGLHSGMVIAGNVGSDLRMNYSVIGDTVNLAARLVEMAPRDEIFLSEETFKLIENVVIAEGPFSTTFRGKAQPVNIYKLRGLKDDEQARKDAMAADVFVGREHELEVVARCIDSVQKRNQVRLFIRGEAGVGKSRLKGELVKMAYRKGVATFEGSCSSFETNTPYYLWTSLLKNLLKIVASTSEHEARHRLHQTVFSLGLTEHEPYLATILSLRYAEIANVDDAVRKQRIFHGMRSLLSALSLRRPIILILEDLHWIDRFSQELLEYVFSRTTSVVLSLFVMTFREEYTQAKLLMEDGEFLDLNRLGRAEAGKLMKLRLDVDAVPPSVEDFVLKRSEGNPFFVQEILKALIDKKKIQVRRRKVEVLGDNIEAGIPGTIQGIIMARIDRLQDTIKEVLFGASVIGREFSAPLLEQVLAEKRGLGGNLDELRTLELILQREEAREFQYLFKHYLIQEVAYNTILINKRKELHASIAEAIEKIYPDRLMEFYEVLAFHYEKAEMWDKAAEYLSRSGHKAGTMYSQEESKEFFERKKAAVDKLYQAASAKPSMGSMLKAISLPLLAMLVPILPIFQYVRWMGKTRSGDIVVELTIGIVITLLLLWYSFALWFLGVVPFLRGRPKMYDILEDSVRVIYRDGTTLAIDFAEIERMQLHSAASNRVRPFWQKLIDPFWRLTSYSDLTIGRWFKEVVLNLLPPYAFGFGSAEGEILTVLKEGKRFLRLLVPWWNTPIKSKDLSLVPFDVKEFYFQFDIALKKWKKSKK
jgi:class 3 adenylate cyclase